MQVPPRFELGSLDSKSRVLTITPWDLSCILEIFILNKSKHKLLQRQANGIHKNTTKEIFLREDPYEMPAKLIPYKPAIASLMSFLGSKYF